MSVFSCETCGGAVKIKTDSIFGTCDSCGKTIEYDNETVKKYQLIYEKAERKMMLNSSAGFKEALALFNDVRFIEGSDDNIKICNEKIAEFEAKEAQRKRFGTEEEEKDGKIGMILMIVSLIALLIFAVGICVFGYALLKGQLSERAMIISGVLALLGIVTFVVSKIKG